MDQNSDDIRIVKLDKLSQEQINRIVDIWVETINWHSDFDDDFTLDEEGRQNFSFMISKAIYEPTQVLYIVVREEEIIGFMYGYIRKHTGFFKRRIIAHISDIAIKDEHRRKGLGTALMKRFEQDFARLNNADEISLYVHILNEGGVEFYRNIGFDVKLLSMRKKTNF